MALNFPKYDHVPLANSPLRQVICQVRFPVILQISQEQPTAFQESIRDRFPFLEVERNIALPVAPDRIPLEAAVVSPTVYRFADKEHEYKAVLAPDFFALDTTTYGSWARFSDHLRFIAQAIIRIYKVQVAVRIGLRYVNVLKPENTGVPNLPGILDLLQPALVAPLRMKVIDNLKQGAIRLLAREDESSFSLRAGIGEEEEGGEQVFILDFDHYSEETVDFDVDGLLMRCDRYHAVVYNAFRWCIREENLRVFQPVP